MDPKNSIIMAHNLPHMAASMVMPYGDDSVLTELLQRLCIIGVFGYEVKISIDAHVKKLLVRLFVELGEVPEVFGANKLLHHPDSVNTALEIVGVAKIVEGDGWVIVYIGVD